MQAAAAHLTPVTLELGGKSPAIVTDSADVEVSARRIAWGKFVNAGQTCVAPDYVLVDEAVHDRFVDGLRKAVRSFYGDDPASSADYGRIVNGKHHARLTGAARPRRLRRDRPRRRRTTSANRYLAPTVLTGVKPDAAVMDDEIFGPILPVLTYSDLDEAIAFVNERPKPLALYVFAGKDAQVDRVVVAHHGRRRHRQPHVAAPRRRRPAVRWRRRERHGGVPRRGRLPDLLPRQARAQPTDQARPEPRLPAVHVAQAAHPPQDPVTMVGSSADVVRRFLDLMQARDWSAARGCVADDAVVVYPVTGERFSGRSWMDMNEAYPDGWVDRDRGDRRARRSRRGPRAGHARRRGVAGAPASTPPSTVGSPTPSSCGPPSTARRRPSGAARTGPDQPHWAVHGGASGSPRQCRSRRSASSRAAGSVTPGTHAHQRGGHVAELDRR